MVEMQRRDILVAGMGIAATAGLAAATPAGVGDPSFMNNVPDGLLSGDQLPTSKFALEKSAGKVVGGSYGKEATVAQLPISRGIAGVSMRLEQGDVGYIAQGYGHSIENVGEQPARVLIGLNAGTYETIDLSQWIAGNPADVLATNFGQPPELFAKFPHRDVFLAS
jgi:oxalate decarboxylase